MRGAYGSSLLVSRRFALTLPKNRPSICFGRLAYWTVSTSLKIAHASIKTGCHTIGQNRYFRTKLQRSAGVVAEIIE